MDIYVYNSAFESIGLLDEYESFIWTDRFYKCGDFELVLKASKEALSMLANGYYIWTPSKTETINNSDRRRMMIIESHQITSDPEEGDKLTITGRSLESILDRRIVWQQTEIGYKDTTQYPDNDDFQEGIKRLINENLISPVDSKRKISNFVFDTTTDTYICGLTLKGQFLGDTLYDIISTNCEDKRVGFKITVDDSNVFHFTLFRGTDHSYSQEDDTSVNITISEVEPTEPGEGITGLAMVSPIKAYRHGIKETGYYTVWIAEYNRTPPFYVLEDSIGTYLYRSGGFDSFSDAKADMKETLGIEVTSQVIEVTDSPGATFKATVNKNWNNYICFSTDFDNAINDNFKSDSSSYKNISLIGGEGEGTDRTFVTYFDSTTEPTGLLRREVFTDAQSNSTSTYADDGETEIVLTDAQYEASLKEKGAESLTNAKIDRDFEVEIDTNRNYKQTGIGDYVDISNAYGIRGKALLTELIASVDKNGILSYPSLVMTELYRFRLDNFTVVSGGSITNFVIKDSELVYKKVDGIEGLYYIYFWHNTDSYSYMLSRTTGAGETTIYQSQILTSLANMISSIEVMLGFSLSSFSTESISAPVKASFNLSTV